MTVRVIAVRTPPQKRGRRLKRHSFRSNRQTHGMPLRTLIVSRMVARYGIAAPRRAGNVTRGLDTTEVPVMPVATVSALGAADAAAQVAASAGLAVISQAVRRELG